MQPERQTQETPWSHGQTTSLQLGRNSNKTQKQNGSRLSLKLKWGIEFKAVCFASLAKLALRCSDCCLIDMFLGVLSIPGRVACGGEIG